MEMDPNGRKIEVIINRLTGSGHNPGVSDARRLILGMSAPE